ncbi:SNF2-related protein [Paraliomyxa miuraensis]|uniref:SNF2-related protein n=1 Tax=Paraliomyxa miuraensis TaxID=376150 RepID=UPI00224EE08D|nr:SNF2-related protein [Paraliomyxa miuraensis]MCX4246028.1 SNF2-related protein [Paraliomyxa miuraensis]
MASHPIRRRYLAESLVRLRRADEHPRYVASQRAGRIDPNPHQIDAVIFALQRIPQGGCILADEVGLGKTIEAGLVIAQRRVEGARRILLITPKPLMGQWGDELLSLFGIETIEVGADTDLREPGVYLVGREQAGSERGAERLRLAAPFDLAVIDEAHEIFAGIYKRYDRFGRWRARGRQARVAARVKLALAGTPVLLLTATPIQNSLTELWGLVQYVEPTGTLLGDLPTFRSLFCAGDDRRLRDGSDDELRRRVAKVCQRTLRRQAQAFMKRPFVDRQARLFEYSMGSQERTLYDDVTRYLLEPDLCAFRGGQRRLLLLGFHRRMASSLEALAASLESVAQRLEGMLLPAVGSGRRRDDQTLALFGSAPPQEADAQAQQFALDLEDEDGLVAAMEDDGEDDGENGDEDEESDGADGEERGPEGGKRDAFEGSVAWPETPSDTLPGALPDTRIRRELERVRGFIERARGCPTDAKLEQLVIALRMALSRPEGSGKAVIFTESLSTQDYLARRLVEAGVVSDEEVTLFRGTNAGPRVQAALGRWTNEVADAPARSGHGGGGGPTPSRAVAIRMALVHEFATRSRVLIATEAGAKGLNLQFCDTVINYDLPWNPQRIEQRIGRCHRYGQTRGVTVINFLNRDNAAQRLTFEILSRKLDLFGTVLDASDVVLHQPGALGPETLAGALGLELEAQLQRIYERARSLDEIEAELDALRGEIEGKRDEFEDTYRRTAGLIESRLDETVRAGFARLEDDLPSGLAAFDQALGGLLQRYLGAVGVEWTEREDEGTWCFDLQPHPALPEGLRGGVRVLVGPRSPALEDEGPPGQRLHLGHSLVRAAVQEARMATRDPFVVDVEACDHPWLQEHVGQRGRLVLSMVAYDGFEPVENLCPVLLLEDRLEALPLEVAQHLLAHAPIHDRESLRPPLRIHAADLEDAIEERLFLDRATVEPHERGRLEEALDRIERFMDDRVLVWEQRRAELHERIEDARRRRDGAAGAAARDRADAELSALEEEHEAACGEISRLRARDDEDYETWRENALQRRYNVPRVTRVLDVELVIT